MKKNELSIEEKNMLYNQVIPIAKEERKKIISNDEVISDSINLLEQLGFFVLKFPSKDDNISGFHIKKSGIDCIYVNSVNTLGRQNFSYWHEYYHAITGEGGGPSLNSQIKCNSIEFKAECFAGYMLMPNDLVIKYLKLNNISNINYIKHSDIIKMQAYFNVSYSAIITRLIQLFPESKKQLGNRYSLGKVERKEELRSKTIKFGGNLDLISSTNDVYVSQSFFNDIKSNFSQGKISSEKVNSLIKMMESLETHE